MREKSIAIRAGQSPESSGSGRISLWSKIYRGLIIMRLSYSEANLDSFDETIVALLLGAEKGCHNGGQPSHCVLKLLDFFFCVLYFNSDRGSEQQQLYVW